MMKMSDALGTAESGLDYFASDIHYGAIADRISRVANENGRFVIVSGDPPPDSHRLSLSLDKIGHSSVVISGGSDRPSNALSVIRHAWGHGALAVDAQSATHSSQLIIVDDAGDLTDEHLKKIRGTSRSVGQCIVILENPKSLAHFERLEIQSIRDTVTTRLRFQ